MRLLVLESLQGLPPLEASSSNSLHPASSSLHAGAPVDHALLPAEYSRVVSQLRKRGEKGHMILALNEVSGACQAAPAGCQRARTALKLFDGWYSVLPARHTPGSKQGCDLAGWRAPAGPGLTIKG